MVANVVYYEAYTWDNVIKPLATIFLGWLIYLLVIRRLVVKLPRVLEEFEHLIGIMVIAILGLLGMVLV